MPQKTTYVAPFASVLTTDEGKRFKLLWGDTVVKLGPKQGSKVQVRARAQQGWVEEKDLGGAPLLELYAIDVGQGDGVLVKTPSDKWLLIDAGACCDKQMLQKGAANFLRWKFLTELQQTGIALDSVIVSHPDDDHFGGMINVLSGKCPTHPAFPVTVDRFYHSGMGRFQKAPKLGAVTKGTVAAPPAGVTPKGTFITELLDGKGTFKAPSHDFLSTFAPYATLVGSSVCGKVARLCSADMHLPGYEPKEDADGVVIRVLGPVLEELTDGTKGLRQFNGESLTRNGHSVALRVDFGSARILLTGDLNADSQRLLLAYHGAGEFAADVAKACHHGSEDIDLDFVKAMQARATVISSGDNEDYSHPRPMVMGASARYGRESLTPDGELLPPLVYSTELARSTALCNCHALQVSQGGAQQHVAPQDAKVQPDTKGAAFRPLVRTPLATDLIYGLVNVRTDGIHVLCATMREKGNDFDVKVFQAGKP